MTAQKAIFPGLLLGITCLIGIANLLLSTPGSARVVTAQNNATRNELSVFQSAPKEKVNAQADGCSISRAYPDSIQQWCEIIERYARENSMDPNLVSAVMLQESAGRSDALSRSGAVGLMQVMPKDGKASSFICKNGPCFADRPSSEELYDPEFNIAFATDMLADLIRHYGSLRDALRAYGPMDVGYHYADLVINIMNSSP